MRCTTGRSWRTCAATCHARSPSTTGPRSPTRRSARGSGDLVVDRCQAFLAAGLTGDAGGARHAGLGGTEPLQPGTGPRSSSWPRRRAGTWRRRPGRGDGAPGARDGVRPPRPDVLGEPVRAGRRAGPLHAGGRPVRLPALRRGGGRARRRPGAEEAAVALLLAGRVAAERGDDGHAELAAAARHRTSTLSAGSSHGLAGLGARSRPGRRPSGRAAAQRGAASTPLRRIATCWAARSCEHWPRGTRPS